MSIQSLVRIANAFPHRLHPFNRKSLTKQNKGNPLRLFVNHLKRQMALSTGVNRLHLTITKKALFMEENTQRCCSCLFSKRRAKEKRKEGRRERWRKNREGKGRDGTEKGGEGREEERENLESSFFSINLHFKK